MTTYSVDQASVSIETHPNPEIITVHTNFNLDAHPGIRIALASIDGVENADWGTRQKYQISMEVGRLFNPQQIGKDAATALLRFIGKEPPAWN